MLKLCDQISVIPMAKVLEIAIIVSWSRYNVHLFVLDKIVAEGLYNAVYMTRKRDENCR